MKQVRTTIDGVEYDVSSLSAIKQFHIMRKLAGVASAIGESLGEVLKTGGFEKMRADAAADPGAALKVIEPIMRALASMSEEDSEYVIFTCLNAVQRRLPDDKGWARVTDGGRNLMFRDMPMATMLQIVWVVLEANVQDFFAGFRIASSDEAAPQK